MRHIRVDDHEVHQTHKKRLVVLAEPVAGLETVLLQAKLVVDIDPTHELMIAGHKLGT
jgi:hypothetical protein